MELISSHCLQKQYGLQCLIDVIKEHYPVKLRRLTLGYLNIFRENASKLNLSTEIVLRLQGFYNNLRNGMTVT